MLRGLIWYGMWIGGLAVVLIGLVPQAARGSAEGGGDASPQARHVRLEAEPTQPGPPSSGYGSQEAYISFGYTENVLGNARMATRVWIFRPDVLKHGSTAPVLVYLHGWTAYLPEVYLGQIEHLVAQGYIVVFPQYQKPGAIGILTDVDQTQYLSRAVTSVNAALDNLGPVADTDDLVIACHSAGCLLAYCWNGAGGAPARALVLTNASLESDDSIPDSVPIVVLEWRPYAEGLRVPLYFLTGEEDPLSVDSVLGYEAAVNSPVGAVFMAQSDAHGSPALVANHTAPLSNDALDALDTRYYFAGIDAVLDHQTLLSFDLGAWSDGVAVQPVLSVLP